MFAQQVRIDPQDNIWIVDQMTGTVMKFDPRDKCRCCWAGSRRRFRSQRRRRGDGGARRAAAAEAWRTSRRGRSERCVQPADRRGLGRGRQHLRRRWHGNARVAKFDKNGKFIRSWGSRGTGPGQFASSWRSPSMRRAMSTSPTAATSEFRSSTTTAHSKRSSPNVGNSSGAVHDARARTSSSTVSNSNPPEDFDFGGEIYKMKSGRNDRRQVRQGRKTAEGVRHRQRHRLPQREQPARRRDQQHAGAEAHVAIAAGSGPLTADPQEISR